MHLLIFFFFISILASLCYFDFKDQILPDILNYSLLWTGLLVQPALQFCSVYTAIIGAIAGYLSLAIFLYGFKWLRNKEGIGLADCKLLAGLGGWFGWQEVPVLLLLASSTTLLVLLILKLINRFPKNPRIPFGPGLCFAGIIIYLLKGLTLF